MTEADIEIRLARIEEKLDVVLKRDDDHETRIRMIEKLVWRASGGFAVASAITGGLLGFVGSYALLGGS